MTNLFIFLQAASEEAETKSESIFDIIMSGGIIGLVIVCVLLILSVIALYIFIERYLTISKAGKIDQNFMNNIRSSVQSGNIQAARGLCQRTDSPVARMVEKGLMRIGKDLKDISTNIENVGNLELFKMEKNLSTLATIAGAAPMIGFFGTVTGMILSFMEMSKGNVETAALASGIYQALITTAFGLFIGILAYVGYNILVSKVNVVVFKMEASSVDFVDLLQEPA